MMGNRYVRILVIFGMVAVMCGTVSAATGIGVETQAMAVGEYPVCTAPCECIAESTAALRWGATGYEMCSKTLCGQSADAMVQYYCIHQVGSTVAAPAVTTKAVTTTAVTRVSQQTVQTQVSSAEVTANPSPSYTWPAAGVVTKKSPVGIATSLAAIGAALLAAAAMRRK
jgi:hypothetical protein